MEHSNRAIEECSMKGPFIAGWAGVRETIKEEYSSIRLAIVGIVLCLFVFWLHWVFVAVRRLSLVVASGGYSSLWCAGSAVVACGLSCSAACGIFLAQGLNPCPLHWQADS